MYIYLLPYQSGIIALSVAFKIISFAFVNQVMLPFVRQGKIPFVPLFIFIEEIVMKVSTTKK